MSVNHATFVPRIVRERTGKKTGVTVAHDSCWESQYWSRLTQPVTVPINRLDPICGWPKFLAQTNNLHINGTLADGVVAGIDTIQNLDPGKNPVRRPGQKLEYPEFGSPQTDRTAGDQDLTVLNVDRESNLRPLCMFPILTSAHVGFHPVN